MNDNAGAGDYFLHWDLQARVKYRDRSENTITTRETITNPHVTSEMKLANDNPKEFMIRKIKEKALFDCDIIAGPSGVVRVGRHP